MAHRDLAAQAPDLVAWLGDYIYESGAATVGDDGVVRSHGTPEPKDLAAYRDRYALYKSDPDLQAAHAAAPWFVIWDDHEVENNYAGITPQDPADLDGFAERRRQAYQAWWEHQPVDLPPPPDDGSDYRIYRERPWGGLLDITLLDGRQYRTDQACGDATLDLDPACPETFDTDRTMLGDAQELSERIEGFARAARQVAGDHHAVDDGPLFHGGRQRGRDEADAERDVPADRVDLGTPRGQPHSMPGRRSGVAQRGAGTARLDRAHISSNRDCGLAFCFVARLNAKPVPTFANAL